MILPLLRFRLRQGFRFFKDIGGIYILLVILLLAGYLLRSVEELLDANEIRLSILVVFIFFSIHMSRSDQRFLKLLNVFPPAVFIAEYLIFSLPLNLVFLFTGNFTSFFILIFSLTAIGFLPAPGLKKSSWAAKIPLGFLPLEAFAIRAGIRRQAAIFIPIYFAGLFLCSYKVAIFIVAFILNLLTGSFFEEIEPAPIISKHFVRENFILSKIQTNSLAVHLLFAPLYLLFLIFHFEFYYLLFPLIAFSQLIVIFGVSYKYAHYFPGRHKVFNSVPLMIFSLCMLLPFFLPVTLGYAYHYFVKAKKNMRKYYA